MSYCGAKGSTHEHVQTHKHLAVISYTTLLKGSVCFQSIIKRFRIRPLITLMDAGKRGAIPNMQQSWSISVPQMLDFSCRISQEIYSLTVSIFFDLQISTWAKWLRIRPSNRPQTVAFGTILQLEQPCLGCLSSHRHPIHDHSRNFCR